MSGHSKWSTIKHKKAALDAKKGGVFTKMAKAISVAVKKGGGVGDPAMNFALRLAVDKARAVNMPKENIERAIAKGTGKDSENGLEELVIEGYGPSGVAVIIEAVTDKRNRTVSELKNIIEKGGGRMGEPGSVMHLFERCGEVIGKGEISEQMALDLIEMNMIDYETNEGDSRVLCKMESLSQVMKYLSDNSLTEIEGKVIYAPKILNTIIDKSQIIDSFIESIEEYDDTQEVFTNATW